MNYASTPIDNDVSEELVDAFGEVTDEERDEAIARIDDKSGGIVDSV